MTGRVVNRSAQRDDRRPLAAGGHLVIVALAVGLLYGVLGCAAGLAGGAGHGTAHGPVSSRTMAATDHGDHDQPESSAQTPSPAAHDEQRSDPPAATGSHPGMACVVIVDLAAVEPPVATLSDSFDTAATAAWTGCADDVDPPVPRLS